LDEHAASIFKMIELGEVDAVSDAVKENVWAIWDDSGEFGQPVGSVKIMWAVAIDTLYSCPALLRQQH
jgi:hypothetical protein